MLSSCLAELPASPKHLNRPLFFRFDLRPAYFARFPALKARELSDWNRIDSTNLLALHGIAVQFGCHRPPAARDVVKYPLLLDFLFSWTPGGLQLDPRREEGFRLLGKTFSASPVSRTSAATLFRDRDRSTACASRPGSANASVEQCCSVLDEAGLHDRDKDLTFWSRGSLTAASETTARAPDVSHLSVSNWNLSNLTYSQSPF